MSQTLSALAHHSHKTHGKRPFIIRVSTNETFTCEDVWRTAARMAAGLAASPQAVHQLVLVADRGEALVHGRAGRRLRTQR
jgi:hypothetical protein